MLVVVVKPRAVLFPGPFPYNTLPFGDPRGFETHIIKGKQLDGHYSLGERW